MTGLREISLFNFRNLQNQQVSFCPGINLIVGPNGQGKTNLIEAINILSATKSFRHGTAAELVRWGERSASIFGQLDGAGAARLGIVFENDGRELYLDDEKLPNAEAYIGRFLTMVFTPLDLLLIKGPASGRRRFLDKIVLDHEPSSLRKFLEYGHSLRNKNRLLKEGTTDAAALDTWDALLSRSGTNILKARQRVLEQILTRWIELHREIAGYEEMLSVGLESGFPGEEFEITEDALFARLKAARNRDLLRKSSQQGPHRGDISILLKGQDSRLYSSQGQAKSIVLALKLACIESIEKTRDDAPSVLLDDVDSELDRSRRLAIRTLLLASNRQVFVTGTELQKLEEAGDREIRLIAVHEGIISE